jgi:hypothetical protein
LETISPLRGAGDPVFKAGDTSWDEKSIEKELDAAYRRFKNERRRIDPETVTVPRALERTLRAHAPQKKAGGHSRLWVKCDDPAWLDILAVERERPTPVLVLTRDNLHRLKQIVENGPFAAAAVAVELTPYIGERELAEYNQAVTALLQAGVRQWFLNNIAHFGFFSDGAEKCAGPFLYAWNSAAVRSFKEAGVRLFATSWEDDLPNIQALSAAAGDVRFLTWLFGAPPLVRSRMLTKEACTGDTVTGAGGLDLKLVFDSGSGVLIPARPVVLFSQKEKLQRAGIFDHGIDLSFFAPDRNLWMAVRDACLGKKKLPEDFTFNFRRGIR